MKDKKQKDKKKVKVVYEKDDGRTLYPMLGADGRPLSEPDEKKERRDAPTKKERRAMICAAYKAALPMLLCFLAGFTIVFITLYLILK